MIIKLKIKKVKKLKKNNNLIITYILIIFIWNTLSIFIPYDFVSIYLQSMIAGIGILAIIWQKKLHKKKFLDMGFRLNKNLKISLIIGLTYFFVQSILIYWLPFQLGFAKLTANPLYFGKDLIFLTLQIFIISSLIMFPFSIFGEELAWRGYILPKLEEATNTSKAIILNGILFSIWHIPVFFSLYLEGAATEGIIILLLRIIEIGIVVIAYNILYLKTREIYIVSFLHVLEDVFVYKIIGDNALGLRSQNAIYLVNIQNIVMYQLIIFIAYILGTFFMYFLCRIANRHFKT